MRWRRRLAVTALVGSVAACTAHADSPEVLRGVDVGGSEADIFLPTGDAIDHAPVVVMLHGTEGRRSKMEPLAAAVAEDGALVYVPDWEVIDQVAPYPEDEGLEPFRQQTEGVVCALRYIRRTAAEHGGDPSDLTVVGFSGGGMVGARVSIVREVPWPGIACDAGVDHRPSRFIGLAGDYEGVYQYVGHPDAAPYDVLELEPTNRDLQVWLLHGHNDRAVGVYASTLLVEHLTEVGISSRLLTTDTTHSGFLDTTTPTGQFAADRISAIVRDEPEIGWWPGDEVDASLVFGPGDSCSYEGPATWPTDRAMTIGVANRNDVDGALAMVSADVDVDETVDGLVDSGYELGGGLPDWTDWFGMYPVSAGDDRSMSFAFVEGDQRFVVNCFTVHDSGRVRGGWMYPAATLAPAL